MATLVFRISSDWEQVVKLRDEIKKLENQLRNFGKSTPEQEVRKLETQLASTKQQMMGLVTEAAKAGAVMESDFKKKIYDASQVVNDFSSRITLQRGTIRQLQNELAVLKERYRETVKSNGDTSGMPEQIKALSLRLREQKDALFNLTQQQATARLSVKKLRDEYALFKQDGGDVKMTVDGISSSMSNWAATIAGGLGIKEFLGQMIKIRGEFENIETSLRVLLGGDTDRFSSLLNEMKEYALISPLTTKDMAAAMQMMIGFGIQAEDAMTYLKALGDISMGNTAHFNSLALAFSQMSAAGKLMGQDLNQMINAGFNPLQQISEKTGKSIGTLKDEMSKGAISAEMVQQAFLDATSAGGKFYGMAAEGAKTINGQISMLQESIDNMFNDMGQDSQGVIIGTIQVATKLVENYEKIGRVLIGLVAAYGVYRTAVIANIVITRGWAVAARADAVAKGLQLVATKALTLATRALNVAMKANPYALIGAAVAGLVVYLLTAKDATDYLREAEERLTEQKQGIIQAEEEHRNKIEELIGIAEDESIATDTRREALRSLEQAYPDIFAKYDSEIEKLSNIKQIQEDIAELEANRSINNPEVELAHVQRQLWDLRDARGNSALAMKSTLEKREAELIKQVEQNAFADLVSRQDDESLEQAVKLRRTLLAKLKMLDADAAEIRVQDEDVLTGTFSADELQYQLNKILDEQARRAEVKSSPAEQVEELRKNYEEALKAYNDFISDTSKDMSREEFEAEAKRLKDAADSAKKEYDRYKPVDNNFPSNGSNAKEENDKRLETERRLGEELVSLRRKNDEAEIDAMRDGLQKKLLQIAFDYKQRRAEIDRQEAEWKKDNKETNAYGMNVNGLTQSQQAEIDRARKIADETRSKQVAEAYKLEFEVMRGNLAGYEDYQQQKLAIAQEYAKKIAEAQTEYERRFLESERDSSLAGIEARELKENIDWSVIFGGFGSMFEDVVRPSLENARKYMQTDEFRNADHESQQSLIEAINGIEEKLGDGGRISFSQLGREVEEWQKSMKALRQAQSDATPIYDELQEAQNRYVDAMANGTEEQQLAAKLDLVDAENKKKATDEHIRSLKESADGWKDTVTDTANGMRTSMDGVIQGLQQISSGSLSGIYNGFIKLGDSLDKQDDVFSKAFGKISDKLEDVPILGWILSIIDIFKDGVSVVVGGLLDSVFNAVSGILDDVLSGNLFVTLGESILKGVGNIFDALTFGGFSSLFGSGESDPHLNEDIERLTQSNEDLKSAIDSLSDKMDNAPVSEATGIYEQQKKYLEESMRNTQEMMQRSAAAYDNGFLGIGGSHSSNKKIDDAMNRDEWARISDIVGRTIDSASDFWTLTSEEMYNVSTDATDLYSKIKGYADDGYKDAAKYMDEYVGYWKEAEELENGRNEKLTAVSFDSIRDDFKSCLLDMESDAEDFSANFEKMMQNAIVESLMTEKYDDLLKSWYKSFAEAMEDGEMSEIEDGDLKKEWDNIVSMGLSDRDALKNFFGWEDEAGEQQSASRGGLETMSQDTADELNGRFTALQEIGVRTEGSIADIKGDLSGLLAQSQGLYNIADDTRNILAQSYLELQQINENTEASAAYLKTIKDDIAIVKQNTSRI